MPDLSPDAGFVKAPDQTDLPLSYATLSAGCDFVARYPVRANRVSNHKGEQLAAKVHLRVMANRIRELDRFLAVLLNEVAGRISGAGHDAEQFERISNTSKKLLAVEALAGMAVGDHGRLRALGRVAARLREAGHHLNAVSLITDMRLASGEDDDGIASESDLSCREAVVPLSLNFATISSFYHDLGHRLIAQTNSKNYSP